MTDVVDRVTRSRMMSGIRGRDTRPEILLRKGLFAKGFRFRLHDRRLPGKPDIVLPRYKAVVLANGCFWHGHNCLLFKWPSSNVKFWKAKISRNQEVDTRARVALKLLDWRVLTVWECALKGPRRFPLDKVLDDIEDWIRSGAESKEISCLNPG